MSQENVEVFSRAVEAYNRGDIDAFLDAFDPMAETHPLTLAMFGQEATVYRGHEGIRQFVREVDEVMPQIQIRVLEVRDLGERIVASGRVHGRGSASGADLESPIAWLVEFKDGKVIRMTDYLDPREALEAANLKRGQAP